MEISHCRECGKPLGFRVPCDQCPEIQCSNDCHAKHVRAHRKVAFRRDMAGVAKEGRVMFKALFLSAAVAAILFLIFLNLG